jgi:cellulose synthase (UDP-forming)
MDATDPLYLLPALLTGAVFVAVVPFLDRTHNGARTFVAAFAGLLGLRYIVWRLAATVLPASGDAVEVAWIWLCYVVELAAMVELLVFLVILSRTLDRRTEADRHERALRDRPPTALPSVDVLIPTFNEGFEVLEKTIVGARALDYPNARVFVLDDGRRAWLAEYCQRQGVGYLTRESNEHAKAGNLNAALARTDSDLVAILDADFVPYRNFLKRTVGFFDEPTVGIVQTPQHFYNRDPIQTNLLLQAVWPDEQRLFFDIMAPCRDAWGAAFCCGSCSVMRRSALQAIGGIPVASVTEDLLTTLAMLRIGFVTVYLNERLSAGLAPEDIEAFFIQRQRWARGAIQSLFMREGPFGRGMSTLHRLLFFPFSWVFQYPVRLMALVVPIVYLWTGMTPLVFTDIEHLLDYQLPMILAFCLGLRWLAPQHYVPMLSTAAGVFATFRLLPSIVRSLAAPFARGFRVTPKGRLVHQRRFDRVTLRYTGLLAALTIAGLILNTVPEWQPLNERSFFPVAAAWSLLNLVVLFIVLLICVQVPQRRAEERFDTDEPARLVAAGRSWRTRLRSLSLGGARIETAGALALPPLPLGSDVTVILRGAGALPATVIARTGGDMRLAFATFASDQREALICKLFTGDHVNAVTAAGVGQLAWAMLRRVFGPTPVPSVSSIPPQPPIRRVAVVADTFVATSPGSPYRVAEDAPADLT